MATLRLTLTIKVDGQLLPGFPLERVITGTEPVLFDRVCPNGVYQNALYGLANFATLLRFDDAADVKPSDDSPSAVQFGADSVYCFTKAAANMAFTPTDDTRVRGIL